MSRMKLSLAAVSLLVLLPTAHVASREQILVPAGSTWTYNDTGSNLGTAWRSLAYNDTTWRTGPAQLGYGDGDESTLLSYGGNTASRYITYYFRRTFSVADPAAVAALAVRFVRDDGSIIYLNGLEVVRSNMPAGSVTSSTRATSAIGGTDESAWQEASVDPAVLVAGTNIVAVEIHQQSPTSTDVSFDLELRAAEAQAPAPTVSLTTPPDGVVSNTAEVTFRATASAAAGLASATVFFGTPPQTVVRTGPTQVEDAQITADTPAAANGGGTEVNVDGQAPHAHGLIRFPALVGTGDGRVPAGAIVVSATVELNCVNAGNAMRLYRLTEDWDEDEATWNERRGGVAWAFPGADGAGSNTGVALAGDCTAAGSRPVDITRFVQEWADGASNYGLVLTDSGTDGIDFTSSESATSPVLTVVYKASLNPVATQTLTGVSATVEFPLTLVMGQTYLWNVRVTDTLGRQSWAPADYEVTADAGSPHEPVLVAPADGSNGVAATTPLEALVGDPGGGSLIATVSLRRAAAPEFTIVALPDTQHYSEAFPAVFTSQTRWIVDNRDARNIVFVTHEGDIVEHYSVTSEWQAADASMSLLDGVVPYGMGPGNHDQPTTLFNQFFPYTRFQGQAWYGGHYGNLNDHNYQLFSGGGMDFVIVHLAFCPSAAAVTWADSVLQTHSDRIGIITTHGYLDASAQRAVSGCASTQYLWDGLAVPNPNVHFMLSGHVHAESRRTDEANGHPVHQMLADFQERASGGEGWLRILRFVPAEDTVYVQTYSPWLNRYETDASSEFTLDFPMSGAFESVGTATVPSGSTVSVTPADLAADTEYEWRVTVTNGSGKSRTGPVWRFTTGAGGSINVPPTAIPQSVLVQEDATAVITVSATDPEGRTLSYAVVNGPAHGTLGGAGSVLVYTPVANYNGPDSFTFRANDGYADSNVATVSITVQAVNDPPSAADDSYSVQAGGTLTVNPPGTLANDTDVDSATLAAVLVASTANGTLALNAGGSFVYTPTAGYAGTDSFTYRASDGQTASAAATVTLTVNPVTPPAPVLTASFNSGQDGFTYLDNTYRGTTQSAYASGSRVATGGFTGGALRILLGGVNNTTVTGMSGGWRRTFTLSAPTSLVLTLRYRLDQGSDYEADEFSQVLASVDGVLVAVPPADYIAQVAGNGNGGAAITTGWQLRELALGTLSAGSHTIILGGYNSRKTSLSERTTVLIDDVSVVVR